MTLVLVRSVKQSESTLSDCVNLLCYFGIVADVFINFMKKIYLYDRRLYVELFFLPFNDIKPVRNTFWKARAIRVEL